VPANVQRGMPEMRGEIITAKNGDAEGSVLVLLEAQASGLIKNFIKS
jgi:hypothetical protein